MKKAVIFDMDGVISDTQYLHTAVESQLLKRFGIEMTPEEITEKYSGVIDEQMFHEQFQKYNLPTDSVGDVVLEKWKLMKKLTKGKIIPIPHAIELIKALKKENFTLAVASGSPKEFIYEVVETLEIKNYFDALVSAREVKQGKPSPDIFLLAAKLLGVEPEEAIVIEDGINGMIAAQRANMLTIGLVKDLSVEYPADIKIMALNEIYPEQLKNK